MKPVMLVACHKPALVPHDGFYMPVHVGHARNPAQFGYQPDDDGENISAFNDRYSELTAVYWAWKNLKADAIGLSHYRRYFRGKQELSPGRRILSSDEADALLLKYDIVVGRPRNYVVETIDSHYRHGHFGADLDALRSVILDQSPEFVSAFDQILGGRKLSLYNMFLMRQPQFRAYCEWLFATLASTAVRIGDETERTPYQRRTLGFLGERLLNVWVAANAPQVRVGTVPIVNTEGEPKLRKGFRFLERKLGLHDPAKRTAG